MVGKAKRRDVEFLQWTGENYADIKEFGGSGVTEFGNGQGLLKVVGDDGLYNLYKGWYLLKIDGRFDVCDEREFAERYEVIDA